MWRILKNRAGHTEPLYHQDLIENYTDILSAEILLRL